MKRIVSLTLAMALIISMVSITQAATSGTYTLGYSGAGTTHLGGEDLGTVRPGETRNYYIFVNGQPATRAVISSDRIDVRTSSSRGGRAIDDYSIKYDRDGQAYLEIEFIDPYVSVNDLEFNVTFYLTESRSRISGTELEITGTLENWSSEVWEDDEYIDLTDWPMVEAEDYIRNIEVYLGQGLSIHARMYKGQKYYGYVQQDVRSGDADLVNRYPSIATIYYLQTIGLNAASNTATFDLGDTYYVYNADGRYVGTTNDILPFSEKYYLSTERIEMETGSASDEPDDSAVPDEDSVPGNAGEAVEGNNGSNSNNAATDNPGTGRPEFWPYV